MKKRNGKKLEKNWKYFFSPIFFLFFFSQNRFSKILEYIPINDTCQPLYYIQN